jgi:hypothetical protein
MSYATVNGRVVTALRLTVGWTGPWFCDLDLDDDAPLEGSVAIKIGDTIALAGTVDSERAGLFGSTRSVRVVGGANGWRKQLGPKDYANDAGVKAASVAQDLVALAGEAMGAFAPELVRLGTHYTRPAGAAAQTLVDVIGAVQWWVGYDGATYVGPRPVSTPLASSYVVSEYDPRSGRAVVQVDDLALIVPGSTITVSPGASLVARDVELVASGDERHAVAWCGTVESGNRLAGMLRSIARQADGERLWGVYPYRVVRMAGDRVELQVASQTAGLPDLLPIAQWYGAPGTHATLAPGTEVLVGFVEGDRRKPYVQSYVDRGGAGAAPVALELGGAGGPASARQGDSVRVTMPVGTFTGDIGGSPATGTITWADPFAYGEITSGSTVVRVA